MLFKGEISQANRLDSRKPASSRNNIFLNNPDQSKKKLMHIVAKRGKWRLIERAIRLGGDVNSVSLEGETPLLIAMKKKQYDIVEALIKKGADPNLGWTGLSQDKPIHHLVKERQNDLVKAFLKKGAFVNTRNEEGETSLHHASLGHINVPLIKLLIENGARVRVRSKKGYTPFHFASLMGHTETLKLYTDRGANVNALASKGIRPLHLAAFKPYFDLRSSFPLKYEKGKEAPLDERFDGSKAVEFLLSMGASANSKTEEGVSPLDVVTWVHKKLEEEIEKEKKKETWAKKEEKFEKLVDEVAKIGWAIAKEGGSKGASFMTESVFNEVEKIFERTR